MVVWLLGIVVGALVGFLIRQILDWGKDWWQERKNSIRGAYATVTSGSVFRGPQARAPAGTILRRLVLTQRGRRVSGAEIGENESNVRWELVGEVNGEFIVGTYRQTSPPSLVDRGAFHLERDPHDPMTYRGLWVGWHPEKRQLTSGEYQWTKSQD